MEPIAFFSFYYLYFVISPDAASVAGSASASRVSFFSVHFSFFVIFSFIFFWGGGDVLFLGLTLFCLRSGNCWNLLVGFFVVFFRLRFFFGLKNRDRVFSDDLFYRLSVAVARLCCLMRALTEFPTSLGTSVARVHLAIAKLGPNLIECECVCVCVSVCVCVCVFLLKSRRELNQELITCGMDSADGYWVFLFFRFCFTTAVLFLLAF